MTAVIVVFVQITIQPCTIVVIICYRTIRTDSTRSHRGAGVRSYVQQCDALAAAAIQPFPTVHHSLIDRINAIRPPVGIVSHRSTIKCQHLRRARPVIT